MNVQASQSYWPLNIEQTAVFSLGAVLLLNSGNPKAPYFVSGLALSMISVNGYRIAKQHLIRGTRIEEAKCNIILSKCFLMISACMLAYALTPPNCFTAVKQ